MINEPEGSAIVCLYCKDKWTKHNKKRQDCQAYKMEVV